ncbi:MAG: hypothetical protein KME11_22530 [Timaviella obliquedivisa GSE-PSE-MK23-08B]|nr:hypothetical protein [Timaviella obliquedivisa GSE-PSE-MK23-08B]
MAQQSFNKPQFSVRRSIASSLLVVETAIALTIAGAFISAPSHWSFTNRATAQTVIQPSPLSTTAADLGEPLTVDVPSPDGLIPVPDTAVPLGHLNADDPAPSPSENPVGGTASDSLQPQGDRVPASPDATRNSSPKLPTADIQVELFDRSCSRPELGINVVCVMF